MNSAVSLKLNGSTQKFLIIAAILQIIWGLVPSASQFVIEEIPVELYIAIRWTVSGLIFGGFLIVKRIWKNVSALDMISVSGLGILGYGIASFGTLYGLKVGGVTNFALMGALSPVISSLIAIVVLRERPEKIFFISLPVAVFGLFLLVIGKYQISSWSVAGMSAGLILGAYVLEALIFVYSKKFKSKMHVAQYLAVSQIATAIFMWLLQFSVFKQIDLVSNLSIKGISAAIFVSVVACVLCYAVLYWLLNYIDGHRLALFDGFHTLSATLFGYLLFHEPLRPLMIVGGVFILIGLIGGNLPRQVVEETSK